MAVNGKQALYVMILHGATALSVVIAATVLSFHGSLDAEAATAIFGAAIGLAGGSAAALGTLSSAVNGKSVVSTESLADMQRTTRAAMSTPGAAPVAGPAAAASDAASTGAGE